MCKEIDGRPFAHPYVRSNGPSLRPDHLSLAQGGGWRSRMAVRPPQGGAKRPVCWACPAVWGWKSPVQPDGGEARVKRKGGTARDRLKEAWNEIATWRTATGYEAARVGRAGRKSRSPYPSKAWTVNPAGVRGRLRGLPQEICAVSHRETGADWGSREAPWPRRRSQQRA